MDNLTFTVPRHPLVLQAMARYLLELSGSPLEITERGPGSATAGEKPEEAAGRVHEFDNGPDGHPIQESCVISPAGAAPNPPAPAATATATAPPAAGVELDADGLPWDARIHSSSAKKGKSGVWNLRRNVPEETRSAVIAELCAAQAATGQPAPELTPAPADGSLFAQQPPAPVAEPAAPPAPAMEPPAGILPGVPVTFADFVARSVVYGQTAVHNACLGCGLPNVPLLATRPDLIPQVWAKLAAEGIG